MNELALFAGAGGGILGGHLLGWRTVCAVEIEDYPRRVLLQRQADGILPRFPIWDDVCTFDGRAWRGKVDVISGGFPCTDISVAGKGAGINGEHSGLWSEFARTIGEVRPRFVFVENSPALTYRGLGDVLRDLAALGYDAEWTVLGAHDVGAQHKRDRIWLLAYSVSERGRSRDDRREDAMDDYPRGKEWLQDQEGIRSWRQEEPKRTVERGMGGMADAMAHRLDRLKAIGNGQVPSVAALAWRTLYERIGNAPT